MSRSDQDHTKIDLKTNVKKSVDPTVVRFEGIAHHGHTPFDVPFISQIKGNLWQGGCKNGLQLPQFFKHVISLYPWEAYTIKHDLNSFLTVKMYDSLDQSTEQVDALAEWINVCIKDGPTLVHCQAGLNRSSLVAARALMLNHDDPMYGEEAVELLREKRSPACLCNPAFEKFILSFDNYTTCCHAHVEESYFSSDENRQYYRCAECKEMVSETGQEI